MSGGGDEVEKDVDAIVAETRVTLDARLFGQNVIVLALEVADDFGKAGLIVNLVAEAGRVNDGEGNAAALLVELCWMRLAGIIRRGSSRGGTRWARTDSDWLYPDTFLDVGIGRVVDVLVLEDILAAEGVDKGGAT